MGVEPASVRAWVRPCVNTFKHETLSNMDISATKRPNITKFYLKHHWSGGKAAVCFGLDGSELWFPRQWIAPIGL